MRTLKIHLIRHGATDANYDGRYIGCKTDLPLAPEGLNELRLLKDDIDYPEIERLYSSPMLRCRQTGAVLYPVIMHGGAIMMLLGVSAVPRHKPVEWTADNGRGYSVRVTPSLYHKSGVIEVYGIV